MPQTEPLEQLIVKAGSNPNAFTVSKEMLKNGKPNFQIQTVFKKKQELINPMITADVKKGDLQISSFQNRDDKNINSLEQ